MKPGAFSDIPRSKSGLLYSVETLLWEKHFHSVPMLRELFKDVEIQGEVSGEWETVSLLAAIL